MNETEENKQTESEQPDTAAAPEVATPADSEKESTATTDAPVEDNKDAEPAKADAVEENAAEAEKKEAVEASGDSESNNSNAEEASDAVTEEPKKKAAVAKQPTPEDVLNIDADKQWFVVQAFSGYEASVKRSLLERIERAGLGKSFGEILVPTEEVVEIRGGQKRKSERKFFPGYVLVQMDLDDETWHLVKDVPRVLGFIGGTADRPAPISAKEADAILQRVQEGVDKPRPKVLFDVGEVVLVIDGPFNDFNGVVEEVNFEKNKLLVAVQIFGRSTPVELEFSQVEKA